MSFKAAKTSDGMMVFFPELIVCSFALGLELLEHAILERGRMVEPA
jgi:hypothetical protein